MNVQIDLLRPSTYPRDALLHDGWKLEAEHPSSFRVSHLQVTDEQAARTRLQRLGLLTSGSLRIEFPPL